MYHGCAPLVSGVRAQGSQSLCKLFAISGISDSPADVPSPHLSAAAPMAADVSACMAAAGRGGAVLRVGSGSEHGNVVKLRPAVRRCGAERRCCAARRQRLVVTRLPIAA
jgi:hypothetical protein